MKSERRRYGLLSNKKYEWEQDRQELKAMKAKANEVGKAKAKKAKRKQLERQATDRYRQRYGVEDHPLQITHNKKKGRSSSQQKTSKTQADYDPFGMSGFLK